MAQSGHTSGAICNVFSVPDITRGDGIFSQVISRLFQTGFYSTRFEATIRQTTLRFWPGPTFYVTTPMPDDGQDHVPPARYFDDVMIDYAMI